MTIQRSTSLVRESQKTNLTFVGHLCIAKAFIRSVMLSMLHIFKGPGLQSKYKHIDCMILGT